MCLDEQRLTAIEMSLGLNAALSDAKALTFPHYLELFSSLGENSCLHLPPCLAVELWCCIKVEKTECV